MVLILGLRLKLLLGLLLVVVMVILALVRVVMIIVMVVLLVMMTVRLRTMAAVMIARYSAVCRDIVAYDSSTTKLGLMRMIEACISSRTDAEDTLLFTTLSLRHSGLGSLVRLRRLTRLHYLRISSLLLSLCFKIRGISIIWLL